MLGKVPEKKQCFFTHCNFLHRNFFNILQESFCGQQYFINSNICASEPFYQLDLFLKNFQKPFFWDHTITNALVCHSHASYAHCFNTESLSACPANKNFFLPRQMRAFYQFFLYCGNSRKRDARRTCLLCSKPVYSSAQTSPAFARFW